MNEEEVQSMIAESIAKGIDKQNKNATIISVAINSILLLFYAHGIVSLIDKVR